MKMKIQIMLEEGDVIDDWEKVRQVLDAAAMILEVPLTEIIHRSSHV